MNRLIWFLFRFPPCPPSCKCRITQKSQCKSRASEPEPFRAVYFYTRLKWTAHSLDNLIHSHNRSHWPSEINPTQVSVHKVSVRGNENHCSKKAKAQNLLSRKATNWLILFYTFLLSYTMYSGHYQIWDKSTPTLEAQFTSLHLSFYILQFFKRTHQRTESKTSHFCSDSRERKEKHCPAEERAGNKEKSEDLKGVKEEPAYPHLIKQEQCPDIIVVGIQYIKQWIN